MSEQEGPAWVKWAGLGVGPVLALMVYLLLPGEAVGGLTAAGRATTAIGVLMAVWWLTEALPLEATSLVPIVALPLTGAATIKATAAPYASDVIFLFMGGLILGLAMERWGLHRRVALVTIRLVGNRPVMLVGGVMAATAAISMWVSNTATAVMMLPIGMGVATLVEERLRGPGAPPADDRRVRNFGLCLMLGIAYASSIGGVGTLVGTPPNAVFAAVAREQGIEPPVDFARWLLIGVPVAAVFLPLTWLMLVKVLYPVPRGRIAGLSGAIGEQLRALGPMGRGERWTMVVFLGAALLWTLREPIGRAVGLIGTDASGRKFERLTDAGIAIAAALALFLLPVDARKRTFVMDWTHAAKLPWGVLLLFGGGLSLADAMTANGVDRYIGSLLEGLTGVPALGIVLVVTAAAVFLTEVASNTAVATVFLPIVHAAAVRTGVHPYTLMLPAALGASYAFMMPMGTPPNALVFATGRVSIRQMARAGILLNLAAIAVIVMMSVWWAPVVWGRK